MRLPFVSRERLEEARRDIEASRAESRIALQRADERYEELLEKFTALRAAGAVIEPKPLTLAPIPAQKDDELRSLISEKCGRNYGLRAIMLRGLAKDRADGLSDDEIRQKIEQGVQTEEGVPA